MSTPCPSSLLAPLPWEAGEPAEHQCSGTVPRGQQPGHDDHYCGCGMSWTTAQSEASHKPGAVTTLTDHGGAIGIKVDVIWSGGRA